MQNEKRKNLIIIGFIVVIVILSVNLVSLLTNNSDTGKEIPNSVDTYDTWVEYLLSRQILDSKISRVRSKVFGDEEDFTKIETITMAEVKEILSNLKNSKLTKVWSQGRGGPDKDRLEVFYEINGQKYTFKIYYGTITVDELDDEFKNILEQNKYDEKNAEYKDMEGSFYFYSIDNYDASIFDKYFDDNLDNNEENNVNNNIKNIPYKIVDETSNEGVVFKKLYVNGKEISFENKATNIEVIQMNDILIVETALSSKTLYAVSKDASVIGVFTTSNNNFYKNTNIIPTKYTYRDTYRIEGNSIYIQTNKFSQDSKYALCNLLAGKDDEVVLYEEKFEYLGNNKFSTSIVTNKVTRKEYMQKYNIKCN